jgi:hypothetical protein
LIHHSPSIGRRYQARTPTNPARPASNPDPKWRVLEGGVASTHDVGAGKGVEGAGGGRDNAVEVEVLDTDAAEADVEEDGPKGTWR